MAKNLSSSVYRTALDALVATDEFYLSQEGFEYPEGMVTSWIEQNVVLPKRGRVLDLCCGDGIWSKGMQNVNRKLELFGIDISKGGIQKAHHLLRSDERHFIVGDAESELPFEVGFFNLIFARGPGLYNQHNIDRPDAIRVIEMWHRKLAPHGLFYSIFASQPEKMGTYTAPHDAKLPYNRAPRRTEAVDFRGGKFHHTIQSFLAPFWKANTVQIVRYSFIKNLHILVTQLHQIER